MNAEKFYTDNIPGLVSYALSFISNEAAANDIAVEMLYKCLDRQDMFETEEAALAYTRVMVKNKCLNYIRHIESRIQYCGTVPESENEATAYESISSEVSSTVIKTIASLPEKTRMIFTMSKVDKIPQKEVAEVMGLSQKSVEYHISQARKALKEALSEFM